MKLNQGGCVKTEELNTLLREFFKSLENDGYPGQDICSATLGAQAKPTYDNFIKNNKVLGVKPLSRIFDNLGYDLHLIPIKKENLETSTQLNNTTLEFVTDSNLELRNFFENRVPTKKKSGRKRVVSSLAEKRAKQLVAGIISNAQNSNME